MRRAIAVVVSIISPLAASAFAGEGTVHFVDGTSTRCDVLFEHPNAPRLVVRSLSGSTAQSFDLSVVARVESEGLTRTYHPARALTEAEQRRRERNGLWGDEKTARQIGRYADERWERKPLWVWRYPGRSGNGRDAGNWLDATGQPVTDSPWSDVEDRGSARRSVAHRIDGDVLLPGAEQGYAAIQPGNRDHLSAVELRHLTVESNADYRVRYTVTGNLWMKDGSSIGGGTQTGGLGSGEANRHTFARFCNYHDLPEHKDAAPAGTRWAYAPGISHWVWIDTGEQGSLEVIGESGGAGDRLTLMRGTLVVSEDSYIGNGNRGSFFNQAGSTVILLDGARVGCPDPLMGGSGGAKVGTYGIAGTLMFGTPDHPLTRDLPFGACYYDRDRVSPDATPGQRTAGGSFVLGPTGRMVIHSADPARARVVFQPRSKQLPVSQYQVSRDLWKYIDRRGKTYYPAKPELWEHVTDRTGVAAAFRGETDFDGVVFDGFYEGGIYVDPAAAAKWRNVSYGDRNHAPPKQLFSDLARARAEMR